MEGVMVAAKAEAVEPGEEDVALVARHRGQDEERET